MMHLYFEFATLIECGSFSEAAERLNLSQSALSKHMMKLENKLGFQLMERTPHGVKVTTSGKRILACIPDLKKAYEKMSQTILEEQSKDKNIVTILSSPFVSYYDIPQTMAYFSSRNPDLEVVFSEKNFQEKDFLDSSYELAFSYSPQQMDEYFEYIPYYHDHLAIALSSAHPLAKEASVHMEQLKNETFLSSSTAFILNNKLLELAEAAGFEPNLKHYDSLKFESMLSMASCNVGITLMMKEIILGSAIPNLVCIDLEPRIDKTVYLIWRKGQKLSPSAKKFIAFVQDMEEAGA